MNMRLILIAFCITAGIWFRTSAATIKLGLFYNMKVETMVFSTLDGEYKLYGDGNQTAVIRKGNMLHITLIGSVIEIHDLTKSYGTFTSILLKGMAEANLFQVKPVYPALHPKESEDDLSVDIKYGYLSIVNTLDLEKYIPGTVEAEGGSVALPEYYKAQAIISRTFAVHNFARHAHDGFNICDGVHCQAFNGKSRMNREIYSASQQTSGIVLKDKYNRTTVSVYHSNCGGITGSASVEWNYDLPYLVPVNDPFCDHSKHRTWTVKFPLSKWNAFLVQKGYTDGSIKLISSEAGRRKFLDPQGKLLLTEIRKEFGLKSSYFNITKIDDQVWITGHGYGHGLGLCQHGAMEMAKVGYTYVDILMFYFRGLKLSTM